jgi:hypothetical protein
MPRFKIEVIENDPHWGPHWAVIYIPSGDVVASAFGPEGEQIARAKARRLEAEAPEQEWEFDEQATAQVPKAA